MRPLFSQSRNIKDRGRYHCQRCLMRQSRAGQHCFGIIIKIGWRQRGEAAWLSFLADPMYAA